MAPRLFALALLLAAVRRSPNRRAAASPSSASRTSSLPDQPGVVAGRQEGGVLWDAAGKQDLFVVTPGSQPVALTDFPVDPDLLQSDLGAFAWISNDEILFGGAASSGR